MSCACIRCEECEGSGVVYWTFGHRRYLGHHRCDDLDEQEECDVCGGSGLESECDECRMLADDLDEEDYEA